MLKLYSHSLVAIDRLTFVCSVHLSCVHSLYNQELPIPDPLYGCFWRFPCQGVHFCCWGSQSALPVGPPGSKARLPEIHEHRAGVEVITINVLRIPGILCSSALKDSPLPVTISAFPVFMLKSTM